MTEHPEVPTIEEDRSPLLGQRLRQARENKKLTISETATQLRISSSAVQALEQEKWELLHGRTYARGYFINYVKFLGLPMDDMMSLFNQKYTEAERPIKLPKNNMVQVEKPFPWLIWAVVIVLVGVIWFAFAQWQMQQQAEAESMQLEQSDLINELNDMAANELFNSTVEPSVIVPAQSLEEPELEPAPRIGDESGELLLSEEVAVELEQTSIETVPEVSQTNTEASADAEMAMARLTMRVDAQCWIEVLDAEGNALFRRIAQDEVVNLAGRKPLSLRLGNAAAVELIFNDQQIDLAGYTQGNVARLTLGAES